MASIAIWEWMDEYQTVVESACDLIRFVGVIFNPILDISTQFPQFFRDMGPIDSDVLPTFSVLTGPTSSTVKHELMYPPNRRFSQYCSWTAAHKAVACLKNVLLFPRIEFALKSNMAWN